MPPNTNDLPIHLAQVRQIHLRTKKAVENLLMGAYRSVFKGTGIDFDELREFQSGDDIRSVSWNTTARMGKPFIKTYREERNLTVHVLVDISASVLFGSGSATKKDKSLEMATAVIFSAIESGDRVGLMLFDNKVECFFPPRKGVRHGLHLVREVLGIERSVKSTNLSAALQFLGKAEKRRCIAFVISDFLSPDFTKHLAPLAFKHDIILVRLIDPIEKNLPSFGLVFLRDLETKEIQIVNIDAEVVKAFSVQAEELSKRMNLIAKKTDARIFELSTEQTAVDSLYRFLSLRRAGPL